MIDSERIYTWLIDALKINDDYSKEDRTAFKLRHKEIHTLCLVIALDLDDDVTANDPSKVLLEARRRMFEEVRKNAKSR